MNVNPNDYNRQERKNSSWWSSRHSSDSRAADSLRHSRKLTLIDMILLLVMMGILVPLVVRLDNTRQLGPYRIRIDERRRDSVLTLILRVKLPSGSSGSDDAITGWRIYNPAGTLLHEEFDLAPPPGSHREFIFIVPSEQPLRCEILAGDEQLDIIVDEDG